ncbi:MAG: YeaH/YhbH family protein [Gammaproteobacteria bacterium]|nr:YeaH/YhbH family protein [Gammaproteobacteria bacterium]
MTFFIDRRENPKNKSAVNRQRFLRRYRKQIRESIRQRLDNRSITNTEHGEKVSIPARDTAEPFFHHGSGGRHTHVLPGNKEFTPGDKLARPKGGGGGAGEGEASDQGEGIDEFVFELSRNEFLDFLFEDMELPNLTKRELIGSDEVKKVRAGYSTDGAPGNISITRSMRTATSRRIALGAGKRRELHKLEAELAELRNQPTASMDTKAEELELRIDELRSRLSRIPFLDDIDIRYHRQVNEPVPTSKAVMFCLMDVSGSMDQNTKSLAKRFFILLYLFLERHYERTEVVYIRHHTRAEEVDEEEFFYSRETGGTVVSSALELMRQIINERYPTSEWNIYGSQASDGDNWPDDTQRCNQLLDQILPLVQYYAYIEISEHSPKALWKTYEPIQQSYPDVFAMQNITGAGDIFPVFQELFRKETA